MNLIGQAINLGMPFLQQQWNHNEALKKGSEFQKRSLRLQIEIARRDILVEIRDQENSRLETLMVMNTLMIGCCFAVLVEGQPPLHSWELVECLYSLTLGISFSMFGLSLWFVTRVRNLMSRYDINDPTVVYRCGVIHHSFHSYFMHHCYELSKISVAAYYFGVVTITTTTGLLLYMRMILHFRAPEAAIVFIVVCTTFFFTLAFVEWFKPLDNFIPLSSSPGVEGRDGFQDHQLSSVIDPHYDSSSVSILIRSNESKSEETEPLVNGRSWDHSPTASDWIQHQSSSFLIL